MFSENLGIPEYERCADINKFQVFKQNMFTFFLTKNSPK